MKDPDLVGIMETIKTIQELLPKGITLSMYNCSEQADTTLWVFLFTANPILNKKEIPAIIGDIIHEVSDNSMSILSAQTIGYQVLITCSIS